MRSMPQALIWETVSQGKWSLPFIFLVAIMLPLLVYGALSGLAIDPSAHEFIALQLGFLQIVLFQLACGVAFAQGPVSRLFALPISTNSIVAWHMISGAVLLALEISVASWLLNTLFHVQWPILGPALFAVAAWAALQVLMCVTSMQSLPAVLLGGAPAVLLCGWLATRYGCYFSPPKYFWSEVTLSDVVTLLSSFIVCYLITYFSVGLARCGERMPTFGIGKWLDNKWDAYMASRETPPAFRSAATAQFWYEWQVKGIALPIVTLSMLAIAVSIGLGAMYFQDTTLESFYEVVLYLGGFVSLLACAAGLFLGMEADSKPTGQRATQLGDFVSELQLESGMGSFLTCRPCTSKQFSAAILKNAAYGSIVSWFIWFMVWSALLLAMWIMKLAPAAYVPREIGVLFFPLTILGPWIAMANLGIVGLSGRGTKILFAMVAGGVGYCVLLGVIRHFTNVFVAIEFHTACTTLAAVFAVLATIWAFAQARKHKHIRTSTSVCAALICCALVIAAVACRPVGSTFIYYPTVVCFATLVVFPFACMPLAIAWNRHR
jgi:hypothetical protein